MPADRLTVAELQAIREDNAELSLAFPKWEVPRLIATIDYLAAVIHASCQEWREGMTVGQESPALIALFQAEEEHHRGP